MKKKPEIIDAPSPNFGARQEGKKIKYIILHYTGTETAFEALRLLQGGEPSHQVSAHYFVDEQGIVTRLVDEEMRAWHAGKSSWEGENDINSCSIGIEIQNPGHDYGLPPFTDDQIDTVIALCRDIMDRHDILPQHVLAHSDIAPDRKKDPGELFPWEKLAAHGIGLWPEANDDQIDPAADFKTILTKYGYDPKTDEKTLTEAFQRHFQPDVFSSPEKVGTPDANTVQIAADLLRKKQANRR